MMDNNIILFEKDVEKKRATVTINRPEKLNAQNFHMYRQISEKIRLVNEDDDVKVLIIKGAGRCFGTGLDVNEIGKVYGIGTGKPGEHRPSQRIRLLLDRLFWGTTGLLHQLLHCSKVTIAQVHGYCYGGSLEVALCADIVIAADNALFTHPGWRYIGPEGDIALLIELVGLRKAKEMMFTGTPIDAQEAYRIGLINKVVPLDRLEEAVNEMAKTVALLPRDGIVIGKANFEAALAALGVETGMIVAHHMHALQTNIRYEPDEFSLLKERRDKGGAKGAIDAREDFFKSHPLSR
jgi:enoyl-CoA hydratase